MCLRLLPFVHLKPEVQIEKKMAVTAILDFNKSLLRHILADFDEI